MLAHSLPPLTLKLFYFLNLPHIPPHQIQVSGLLIEPEQTKKVFHIAITLVDDKAFSLFSLKLDNLDVLLLFYVADNEQFVALEFYCDQEHATVNFADPSQLFIG